MSEAVTGDIICKAGRGTKCVHKRNSLFLGGQIQGMTCAIKANWKVCSKVGLEVA